MDPNNHEEETPRSAVQRQLMEYRKRMSAKKATSLNNSEAAQESLLKPAVEEEVKLGNE